MRKRFKGVVKFADLDCKYKPNQWICKHDFPVSSYPSLRLYHHSAIKTPKQDSQRVFSKNTDLEELDEEIRELFFGVGEYIRSEKHFSAFAMHCAKHKRKGLIWVYKSLFTPIGMRAIAIEQKYRDNFFFANYRNPPLKLQKEWGIENDFPLAMIYHADMESHSYDEN